MLYIRAEQRNEIYFAAAADSWNTKRAWELFYKGIILQIYVYAIYCS